ncbi:chemoreceptor glutamine deamidase CheD, partial [Burkholderia pseudomallei]
HGERAPRVRPRVELFGTPAPKAQAKPRIELFGMRATQPATRKQEA